MLLSQESTTRLHSIIESFSSEPFTLNYGSLSKLALLLIRARKESVKTGGNEDFTIGANDGSVFESTDVIASSNTKTPTKKRNGTCVNLTELFTSHLLALLCMLSYVISPDIEGTSCHDYLIKFDAGMGKLCKLYC